jgi:hypothetical protein
MGPYVEPLLKKLCASLKPTPAAADPSVVAQRAAVHLLMAKLVYVFCVHFADIGQEPLKELLDLTKAYAESINMNHEPAEKARNPPARPEGPAHPYPSQLGIRAGRRCMRWAWADRRAACGCAFVRRVCRVLIAPEGTAECGPWERCAYVYARACARVCWGTRAIGGGVATVAAGTCDGTGVRVCELRRKAIGGFRTAARPYFFGLFLLSFWSGRTVSLQIRSAEVLARRSRRERTRQPEMVHREARAHRSRQPLAPGLRSIDPRVIDPPVP